MKKLLIVCVGLGFAIQGVAQDAAEKKVQAGIIIGTGMNFQRMGTKNMSTNGIGGDFNIGANLNFSLNDNIAFSTGLELDFSSTKFKATALNSNNNPVNTYYRYSDTKILNKDESDPSNTLFQLDERKQGATYLTIPTMLLFRTKYIGYFRYFGKFGLRNSILVGGKITDQGSIVQGNTLGGTLVEAENTSMTASNNLFFYKGSVGMALGADWNFSGATCLVAELGFYYGITPLFFSPKEENRHLFTENLNYFSNNANQSQLMLKVAVLF
jgi:hypothetical protein